jgi:hypothetical protein
VLVAESHDAAEDGEPDAADDHLPAHIAEFLEERASDDFAYC